LKGAKATAGVIDAAGRLVVNMSTISPLATRRLSTELAGKGVAMVDAPVSGGPTGARFVLLRGRRQTLQTLKSQISFRTATMSRKRKPRLVAASGASQTATLGRSATLTRPVLTRE
jgi:hypothetical protein